MENYTDIMVDIETTSTSPDRGAILQISAVKFNLKENIVCPVFFDKCLTMPPHRHFSESTRSWWVRDKKELLIKIMNEAQYYKDVMQEFHDFCLPTNSLNFWSKPTHFDFPFLSSYFTDCELQVPFHYRNANDLNTFLRGMYYPNPVPDLKIEFNGTVHNALDDTLNQVQVLLTHVHGNKTVEG